MTMRFTTPNTFEDILSGTADTFGLLKDVKPLAKKNAALSTHEQNFLGIVEFYERTGRIPSIETTDFQEKLLAARLSAFRSRPELKDAVKQHDRHGLLEAKLPTPALKEVTQEPQKQTFRSLDDLLQNDNSGLLGNIDSSIFRLEHVGKAKPDLRSLPKEIASRKPCEDFFKFEKRFHDAQRDILNRKAQTFRFKNETMVEVGDFFILGGLLCFVDSILEDSKDGARRDNPRYRVIFENGVETNILKLSFARALYKDPHGRRVQLEDFNLLDRAAAGISQLDRPTGCIYVLASETKAPELAELKRQGRLVKIGYSSQNVQERVKNAENDPTYLEAPVRILASLDCFNLNPQKVEHLIHAFLAKQRINMTLINSKGKPYRPTEWFAVDLKTAVTVAEHIVAGDIMKFRMDNTTGRIKRIAD